MMLRTQHTRPPSSPSRTHIASTWARLFSTSTPPNKTTAGQAIPARQAELVHLLAKAHRLQGSEQEAALTVCSGDGMFWHWNTYIRRQPGCASNDQQAAGYGQGGTAGCPWAAVQEQRVGIGGDAICRGPTQCRSTGSDVCGRGCGDNRTAISNGQGGGGGLGVPTGAWTVCSSR